MKTSDRTPQQQQRSTPSKATRGIIVTLMGAVMWGFSGACGQYLLSVKHLDPSWLAATRMMGAGVLLSIFGFMTQKEAMVNILKDGKERLRLVLFAIFGLTFCQFSYLTAIAYSNAGTATVLQYLGPAMIMITSCFMAKKLPSLREVTAIILAILGTFLLATHGNIHSLVISRQGLIWGLLSAVSLMLYTMLPERIIGRWGSTVVTSYGMLIGGVFLFFTSRYWQHQVNFDLGTILGVTAMVVIGTALAFTLYLQGVSDIGSVKASMLACVEPVSATVFSVIWLKTSFTLMDLAGLIAIITTVFLLTKKQH